MRGSDRRRSGGAHPGMWQLRRSCSSNCAPCPAELRFSELRSVAASNRCRDCSAASSAPPDTLLVDAAGDALCSEASAKSSRRSARGAAPKRPTDRVSAPTSPWLPTPSRCGGGGGTKGSDTWASGKVCSAEGNA